MSKMDRLLEKIDQPVLLIDEEVTRRNIDRMVSIAHHNQVSFRPHFKTHQSAEIGGWFREKGVSKITVSSVEMAEYFADHGWDDILIAFSLNPRQLDRIQALAHRIHLGVLLENEVALASLDTVSNSSSTKLNFIKKDLILLTAFNFFIQKYGISLDHPT